MLLRQGNHKTGRPIALFNLSPGQTCPGASELCSQRCYAIKGNFTRFAQHVGDKQAESFRASQAANFVDAMCAELAQDPRKIIRLHSSGDFYSAAYTRAWARIVRRTPDKVFYAYTRSWREPKLLPALEELRRLPNMQLWWSADRETGRPPEGLVAYMMADDLDLPLFGEDAPDFDADLIFRVHRATVRKTVRGVPVCPKENGTVVNLTCAECRVCFSHALRAMGEPGAKKP